MNQKSTLLLAGCVLSLLTACSSEAENPACSIEHPVDEVHRVMDAWHHAASVADSSAYFGAMASDKSIFIGTDETERWTTSEFKIWSRRYFQRASAWTFVPVEGERHVQAQGDVAWLDEKLDSEHMGRCRGTGILTFDHEANSWKIAHYTLSYAVPNEVADSVLQVIEHWNDSK
jgi:ketosteroid isomerase-like protein